MRGRAIAAAGRIVATAAAGGDLIADLRPGGAVDGCIVFHRVGADGRAHRKLTVQAAAAAELRALVGDAAEAQAGVEHIVEFEQRRQRRIADVDGDGVADGVADTHRRAARRIGALGDGDDRLGDHRLCVRRVGRTTRTRAGFVARCNHRIQRNRAGVARCDHVIEAETQQLTRHQRGRHAGESDGARRCRVVGGRHTCGHDAEIHCRWAGGGHARIAQRHAVGDARGRGIAGIAESKAAIGGIARQHGGRHRGHGADIHARHRRNDLHRFDEQGRTLQRPQIEALGGAEVISHLLGWCSCGILAILVRVGTTGPAAIILAAAVPIGVGRIHADQ